jgi:hypothetical protein
VAACGARAAAGDAARLVFLLAQIEVRFLGFRFAAMHERDLLYARE